MRTLRTDNKIIYKELSYKIVGLLYKTHDELGRYARESQYGHFLEQLLKENNICYEREKVLLVADVCKNKADFIIDDKIILELKVRPAVTRDDYYQIQRYLQASNLKLGLLINFRQKYLSPKRIINYSNK